MNWNASRQSDHHLVSTKLEGTLFKCQPQGFLITKGANYFSVAKKFLLDGFLNVGPYCIQSKVKEEGNLLGVRSRIPFWLVRHLLRSLCIVSCNDGIKIVATFAFDLLLPNHGSC